MMIKDRNGKEAFYMDKKIYVYCKWIRDKVVNTDSEAWIAFVGDTGCGKSLCAQKWGYVIDPNINNQNICLNHEEFVTAIINAKKGEGRVIVADEGISIFFSRAAMTKDNRVAIELMNQIRQKNLIVMVNVPDIMALDYYLQEKLCCIVEVSEDMVNYHGKQVLFKGNQKVYPDWYGVRKKSYYISYLRKLRRNTRKKGFKPAPEFNQLGNPVTNKPWYPVNEEEYRFKKESVLDKYIKELEDKKTSPQDKRNNKFQSERDKAIYKLNTEEKRSQRDLARLFSLSQSAIKAILDKFKQIE